jgi:hypothetical protein
MLITENQRGFNRRNFPRSRFGNIDQQVINWRKRAIGFGSAHISTTTMKATDFLYKEMKKTGLLFKMKSVVGFCPCNLIAATTPIYYTHGNAPWTNTSFTDSDLNIHGLKGDGTTKHLNTGLNPTTMYTSDNSAGITLYATESTDGEHRDFGCDTAGSYNPAMMAYVTYLGTAYWDAYNFNTGRVSAANSVYTGYISFNRASASSQTIHRFNSRLSHSLLASGTGAPGTRPNLVLYCFAGNESGTTTLRSAKRFSFAAVHEGLTEDESRTFSWIIQNYRVKLGGGFI